MLEQYTDHPPAYEKIVLVSPGYMVAEIQKLRFNQVMWPSVFAMMSIPKQLAAKIDRDARKQMVRKLMDQRNTMPASISSDAQETQYSQVLLGFAPHWSANDAMAKPSNGIGKRTPVESGSLGATTLGFSEGIDFNEEID